MPEGAMEAAGQAGEMAFSGLEFALLSLIFTVVGGIIVGIIVRYLSSNRFMTKDECEAKHANDCRYNTETARQIEELKRQQEMVQTSFDGKIHIIFRMVRGLVVYSDISAENKEKILNERGRDIG